MPTTHIFPKGDRRSRFVEYNAGNGTVILVPGLGRLSKEELATTLGEKAERQKSGAGTKAYEHGREMLENEDNVREIHRRLGGIPARAVGQIQSTSQGDFFALEGKLYKLRERLVAQTREV